jgi:predicted ferric reductase
MQNKKLLAGIWAGFGLLMPVIPLWFYFSGNWYSLFHSYSLGMVFGIFSYGYFLNTLMLSARIPFFDRIFGHDRVMVFHGYYASLGLIFAVFHYIFKEMFSVEPSAQIILGSAAFAIFLSVIAVTSLLMITGIMQLIPVIAKLKQFLSRTWIGDYSKLKLFHNTVFIAAVLLALHVYMASSTQESLARMWIMGVWACITLAVYIYHKIIRVIILYKRKWQIEKVTELTPEIVEFDLKRTKGTLEKHRAGQFAYIRVLSKTCGYEEHPFTLSSAPGEKGIRFIIKNLGDYTGRLEKVTQGTSVLVDGPYGIFTPELSDNPMVFIAGGIGITPFLSILKEWDAKGLSGPVILVWSCRLFNEMIHKEFFEELQDAYEQFRFVPVATREEEEAGRINKDMLESIVASDMRKTAAVYICGPEKLRRSCISILKEMELPAANIHFEKFSS